MGLIFSHVEPTSGAVLPCRKLQVFNGIPNVEDFPLGQNPTNFPWVIAVDISWDICQPRLHLETGTLMCDDRPDK